MPSVRDAGRTTETWQESSHDEETTMDGYKYNIFRKIRKEEEEVELYFM